MNLDIAGTKHEKVVIIVLAYVMGFTAGFICFGVTMPHTTQSLPENVAVASEVTTSLEADLNEDSIGGLGISDEYTQYSNQAASVTQAIPEISTNVTYENGRLEVQANGETRLLSVLRVDTTTEGVQVNQGFHTAVPNYAVSQGGAYVYFCEQIDSSDTCSSFIYDVAANVIRYVSFEGVKLVTTVPEAAAATWTSAGLSIGTKSSADPTNPAILITN